MSGRFARTSAVARTSQALAAKENWTWLATVVTTLRVPKGSMAHAAISASVIADAIPAVVLLESEAARGDDHDRERSGPLGQEELCP